MKGSESKPVDMTFPIAGFQAPTLHGQCGHGSGMVMNVLHDFVVGFPSALQERMPPSICQMSSFCARVKPFGAVQRSEAIYSSSIPEQSRKCKTDLIQMSFNTSNNKYSKIRNGLLLFTDAIVANLGHSNSDCHKAIRRKSAGNQPTNPPVTMSTKSNKQLNTYLMTAPRAQPVSRRGGAHRNLRHQSRHPASIHKAHEQAHGIPRCS